MTTTTTTTATPTVGIDRNGGHMTTTTTATPTVRIDRSGGQAKGQTGTRCRFPQVKYIASSTSSTTSTASTAATASASCSSSSLLPGGVPAFGGCARAGLSEAGQKLVLTNQLTIVGSDMFWCEEYSRNGEPNTRENLAVRNPQPGRIRRFSQSDSGVGLQKGQEVPRVKLLDLTSEPWPRAPRAARAAQFAAWKGIVALDRSLVSRLSTGIRARGSVRVQATGASYRGTADFDFGCAAACLGQMGHLTVPTAIWLKPMLLENNPPALPAPHYSSYMVAEHVF